MKIVTLNTWGKYGPHQERWDFLLEELVVLNPDLICLQEVGDPILTERIKDSLGLPYALTAYESGLAVIARIPLVLEQVLKYRALSPTEHEERRAILSRLKMGAEKIIVANTHLSWKPEDNLIRHEQTKELIQSVRNTGLPALLAGDFNDESKSETIREIKKAGYHDLWDRLHPAKQAITWDNRNPFIQTHKVMFPDRQIDFLFLQKELFKTHVPAGCEIVFNHPNRNGIYPSDHYGVFAEIKNL